MNRRRNITFAISVVMIIQIVLLDGLQLTSIAIPMPYVMCIIFLPLGMPRIALLLTALAIGIAEDMSMGLVGLNTAALLPLAFFRPNILSHIVQYQDRLVHGRLPSRRGMGSVEFNTFVVVSIVLHHFLFFTLEWMSFDSFWFYVKRLLTSTSLTIILVYALMLLLGRALRDE